MIARAWSCRTWAPLRSPLSGVSNVAWTEFARRARIQGAWEVSIRRIGELGLPGNPSNESFRYAAFAKSARDYDERLVAERPAAMTRAAAVAFLLRTCPRGEVEWGRRMTKKTRELCDNVADCF